MMKQQKTGLTPGHSMRAVEFPRSVRLQIGCPLTTGLGEHDHHCVLTQLAASHQLQAYPNRPRARTRERIGTVMYAASKTRHTVCHTPQHALRRLLPFGPARGAAHEGMVNKQHIRAPAVSAPKWKKLSCRGRMPRNPNNAVVSNKMLIVATCIWYLFQFTRRSAHTAPASQM